jgi:hypothetical protein
MVCCIGVDLSTVIFGYVIVMIVFFIIMESFFRVRNSHLYTYYVLFIIIRAGNCTSRNPSSYRRSLHLIFYQPYLIS